MLLLAVSIAGICIMFGLLKLGRLYSLLLWLIAGSFLLSVVDNELSAFYVGQSWPVQVVALITLPFLFLIMIRLLFPNSPHIRSGVDFLWGLLIFFVTLPIRFFWRSGRQIVDRERSRIRLQRYHPVAGQRPPLRQAERRNPNDGY